MKAQIIVNYEGIHEGELKDALQGLRNVEQENPERITMFILVNAPELKTGQMVDILKGVDPPLPFIKVIDRATSMAGNRDVQEHQVNVEGGPTA